MAEWDVQYARTSDGIDIAYVTYGEGPTDVVLIHGFTTHLDLIADSPWHAYWARCLGERFRLIQLDKRGSGLSDRTLGHGSIEDRTRDVLAVMDAAGSDRASVVGISEGGPMALTLAATHPERVHRLVLYGTFARLLWAPDHPAGHSAELAESFNEVVTEGWGNGQAFARFFINHAPDTETALRVMAKMERNACTPQMASEILRRNMEIDVSALLPSITVPTLVMHNAGDALIPVGLGRHLAETIPGAEYLEGDGDYHCTWVPKEFEPLMDRALAFLGAASPSDDGGRATTDAVPARPARPQLPSRAVATILFTDIVGSTDRAVAMGDEAWGRVLSEHHRHAVDATRDFGGTLVKTTGDGVLALFDGPSRAIQAVQQMSGAIAPLDLQLRAGIHTGEVERTSDDVLGIGVHVAARVMGRAGPEEILTSRTVRDLAAGSGIVFADRGHHGLKGIPGEWDIYAVTRG
jgi:class 3 adenylate cyclase/pimeloyl-ACP methyl ester carboxylesterase